MNTKKKGIMKDQEDNRLPLEITDRKLLVDDGRILNLVAHDPQKWHMVIKYSPN